MGLLELVANISEGRDRSLVRIVAASAVERGARLLDVHLDPDHNRSVLTLAGPAEVVALAAVSLAAACLEQLDIRAHAGAHPRLGVLDVCPFVPLEAPVVDALAAAANAAAGLARLGLPVFFYGAAAPGRRSLPQVRKHAFVDLEPDLGPAGPHARGGAVAVGVRGLLVAYNIDLETRDLAATRRVAAAVRETNGGPPGLRALAMWLPSQGRMQVSMNITRPGEAGVGAAWAAVAAAAAEEGLELGQGELVGLVPEAALQDAPREVLEASGITAAVTLERALADAGLRDATAGPIDTRAETA